MIDNETYSATQSQLVLVANLVAEMPIGEFLERAEHADAIAPLLNPTLWMQASKKLAAVIRLARAAAAFKAVVEELRQEETDGRERAGR